MMADYKCNVIQNSHNKYLVGTSWKQNMINKAIRDDRPSLAMTHM